MTNYPTGNPHRIGSVQYWLNRLPEPFRSLAYISRSAAVEDDYKIFPLVEDILNGSESTYKSMSDFISTGICWGHPPIRPTNTKWDNLMSLSDKFDKLESPSEILEFWGSIEIDMPNIVKGIDKLATIYMSFAESHTRQLNYYGAHHLLSSSTPFNGNQTIQIASYNEYDARDAWASAMFSCNLSKYSHTYSTTHTQYAYSKEGANGQKHFHPEQSHRLFNIYYAEGEKVEWSLHNCVAWTVNPKTEKYISMSDLNLDRTDMEKHPYREGIRTIPAITIPFRHRNGSRAINF